MALEPTEQEKQAEQKKKDQEKKDQQKKGGVDPSTGQPYPQGKPAENDEA